MSNQNNTPNPAEQDFTEWRKRLQGFTARLNVEPNPAEVKTNPHANNTRYIPISHLEMALDEYFFGLWEIVNFRWERLGNEICGALELRVFHPTANIWITRTGSAATQIRLQKGAQSFEIEKKFVNSLEMDFPHLKADCLRNACQSLGKSFGRDLNRKEVDAYKPIIAMHNAAANQPTIQASLQQELERARYAYDVAMNQARMGDDDQDRFAVLYQSAESPAEIWHLVQKVKEFIPDNDPRKQYTTRAKIQ